MRSMRFDEKADTILAAVAETGKRLTSLTADVTLTIGSSVQAGPLVLKNPSYGRLTLLPKSKGAEASTSLYDGKYVYEILGKEYTRTKAKSIGELWPFLFGFEGVDPKKLVYSGTEQVEGVSCDVLVFSAPQQSIRIFVSPARVIQGFTAQIGVGQKQEMRLTNVKLDVPVTERFQLPSGLKEHKEPQGEGAAAREKSLLPVGVSVPPLKLTTASGKPFSLPSGKPTLVVFWTCESGPCRATLPELQALFMKYKRAGLQVVGLNPTDKPEAILAFCRARGYTFTVAPCAAEVARPFGVETYPTCFLVNATGKVVYRAVGYDAAGLTAAVAKLGLK